MAQEEIIKKNNVVLNDDCMTGMKQFPDGFFDLAIVDPVYGDVRQGGYMKNTNSTARKARAIEYNNALWSQNKTPPEYFTELFRVSKNQVIWGGELFHRRNSQGFARLDCMG